MVRWGFVCLLVIGTLTQIFCANRELMKNEEEDDEIQPFSENRKIKRDETSQDLEEERHKDYWNNNAFDALHERVRRNFNTNRAHNVIFFLGDGMSIPTIAASRMYMGGEEKRLSFEKFPYTGLSKTYCVDHQTADSACSATAYLCGVKANLGTIGVSAAVKKRNCTAMNEEQNRVDSIARLFQLKGKRTGLVTTARVTHASPAGVYAHTAYRNWESDSSVVKSKLNPRQCEDIAHQLVFGPTERNLRVVLGGGREKFFSKKKKDQLGNRGDRSDRVDLIKEWMDMREAEGVTHEYVWNRDQLVRVANDTEYLLGLFQPGHMHYNLDRDPAEEPSLEEMTAAAIKVLDQEDQGFFLFVEGGRIDTAHHSSKAHKALDETIELSKAVQKAVDMTSENNTLIIVTSDHAHTMSYSGYAERGSDIFGYAGKASDSNYYTILNYANGPGYKEARKGSRYVPSIDEINEIGFRFPSAVPLDSETHGADDVAIFARGPWEHLFSGVMEENVIPHLIAYAACVSPQTECHNQRKLA